MRGGRCAGWVPWTATLALVIAAGGLSRTVVAAGEALPKGDEAEEKSADKPADKAPKAHRNCFLDLTAPPGGNGHFSDDGKALFLLAQTSGGEEKAGADPQKKKAKANGGSKEVRYTLVEVATKTRKSQPLLSLDHRPNASLLTYGEPVVAASAIGFAGRSAGCFEGPGGVTTVSFAKEDAQAAQTSGVFQLVETPKGRLLVDTKKHQILESDPETFQKKGIRRVPDGERPLFFDPVKKVLITWADDGGEQRGLVRYADGNPKPTHLAFKRGDRVLQTNGRFAAARMDAVANTIEVIEVAGWTKVEKPAHYKVQVPPVYTVTSAGIDINFDKKLMLVFGANFLAKQHWQRVLIFNYATGRLLGDVPVTGTQYLNFAGIDPTGAYAVVEIRDMNSRKTVGAKVFNVAKKTFDDLDLALPKEEAAPSANEKKNDKKKSKKVKDKAPEADDNADGNEDD